jgi:hypothetical protein
VALPEPDRCSFQAPTCADGGRRPASARCPRRSTDRHSQCVRPGRPNMLARHNNRKWAETARSDRITRPYISGGTVCVDCAGVWCRNVINAAPRGFSAAVAGELRRLALLEVYGRPMPGTSGVHGTVTAGGRHVVTMVLCRAGCVRRGGPVCAGQAPCADAVRGCPCGRAARSPRARTYSGQRRHSEHYPVAFAQVR